MIDGREVMRLAVPIDADNVSNFSTFRLYAGSWNPKCGFQDPA